MLREILRGTAAGALGTVALNVTTYLDMAVRARPASSTPQRTVDRIAELTDTDLAPGESGEDHDDTADNRSQGLGALMGYVAGLGVGAAYGCLRSRASMSTPAAAVLLGGAAMVGTNGPMIGLKVTDPREWSATSWVVDIVPHLLYGAVAAAAYDAITDGRL